MLLPSSSEMAEVDRLTNCDPIDLMERAGVAIARELLFRYNSNNFLVLVGPGNNGGDGLVIARELRRQKRNVRVIASASAKFSELWMLQATRYLSAGGSIEIVNQDELPIVHERVLPYREAEPGKKDEICSYVKIDCLLGIGQKKDPRLNIADLITLGNFFKGPWVAIDVPTGIDSTSGVVYQPNVTAQLTLTVELIKRGMIQFPARAHCGVILIVEIGIDHTAAPIKYFLLESNHIKQLKRKRVDWSHKGMCGNLLVLGGCSSMPGAPYLAAQAGLKCGAGKVSIASTRQVLERVTTPEVML
jgi:ADP-dependent NAD(P)H-hydrate dehydratase / NAD(P)H-hydrate epimerase